VYYQPSRLCQRNAFLDGNMFSCVLWTRIYYTFMVGGVSIKVYGILREIEIHTKAHLYHRWVDESFWIFPYCFGGINFMVSFILYPKIFKNLKSKERGMNFDENFHFKVQSDFCKIKSKKNASHVNLNNLKHFLYEIQVETLESFAKFLSFHRTHISNSNTFFRYFWKNKTNS
jgi:hypothetical protein